MKEIAEVYGNGFLQIAGGIGALLLFFHAVDGQGMIGMVLRYYMTGICGSKVSNRKRAEVIRWSRNFNAMESE